MIEQTIVRALTQEDYSEVRRIDDALQRQYRGENWDKLSEEEKDNYLVSRPSEFAINLQTGYCFVAIQANKIVGFLFAHEMLPFQSSLYIRYIGIDPQVQGQGIGVLLYEKLVEKARQQGTKQIRAHINLDNPHSMRLHQKVGFDLRDRKEALLDLETESQKLDWPV